MESCKSAPMTVTGNDETVGLIQHVDARSPEDGVTDVVKYKAYPGRFYVLMVLSFIAIQQNVVWMTFGAIPLEARDNFNLSSDEITLLAGISQLMHIGQLPL